MKRTIPFLLMFAAVAGLLVASSLDSRAGAQSKDDPKVKPYKMVAELHVVMEHMDDLFYGIEDNLKGGKFRKVRESALVVAELSNVSTYSTEFGKKDGWAAGCAKVRDQLVELAKAAKDKDKGKVESLFKAAEATCDGCHEKFRD